MLYVICLCILHRPQYGQKTISSMPFLKSKQSDRNNLQSTIILSTNNIGKTQDWRRNKANDYAGIKHCDSLAIHPVPSSAKTKFSRKSLRAGLKHGYDPAYSWYPQQRPKLIESTQIPALTDDYNTVTHKTALFRIIPTPTQSLIQAPPYNH